MSTEVTNIIASTKTRVQAVLGSYSELAFAIDISKNNFKGNASRFAVLAKGLEENEDAGVFGSFTVSQRFEITLTNSFKDSPAGDLSRRNGTNTILDNALLVYKDLVGTKCGLSSTVINVSDLIIEDPNYLEEDNVIAIKLTINILYRKEI